MVCDGVAVDACLMEVEEQSGAVEHSSQDASDLTPDLTVASLPSFIHHHHLVFPGSSHALFEFLSSLL